MATEVNKRISSETKTLMIIVAIFVDLIELIIAGIAVAATLFSFGAATPLISLGGLFTTFMSWAIFVPWFWTKGVTFSKSPKFARSFGFWAIIDFLLSSVGVDGFLPEFTLMVWRNIKAVETEDVQHADEQAEEEKEASEVQRKPVKTRTVRQVKRAA